MLAMAGWSLLTAVVLAGLLLSDSYDRRPLADAAKIAASSLFVIAAIEQGTLLTPFGRILLIALLLSWLGDILLIGKSQVMFLAGLGSFLLAHLAFAGAFVAFGIGWTLAAGALLFPILVSLPVLRWLRPHLSARMQRAVLGYCVAIGVMTSTAIGTLSLPAVIGGVVFLISDLFVARDRFVHHSFANRAVGLPLYYAAQLLFVSMLQQ